MKEKYYNKNVFVALPSKIKDGKAIQNIKDITIIDKKENNVLIDIYNNEEIYFFDKDNLTEGKKYINVFNNDFLNLSNYIYSLYGDNINDLNSYFKIINNIKTEYNKEELIFIVRFLKKEIQNIDYPKTKRITRSKRKIRKKNKK